MAILDYPPSAIPWSAALDWSAAEQRGYLAAAGVRPDYRAPGDRCRIFRWLTRHPSWRAMRSAVSSRRAFSPRMVTVVNVWSGVTIDCLDPQRVARFWSALLGREPGPSQAGWVYLGKRDDPQPRLIFQPVTQPKTGKVRIHLDVTVDDISDAINVVTSLGGCFTGERHEYNEGVVVVMADPENHEFCLVQYY